MIISGSVDSYLPMVLGGLSAVLGVATFYFYNKCSAYDRNAHLVSILIECKKQKKPMGIVIDKSGKGHPVVIEQNPKNKGLVKSDKYTLVYPDLAKASAGIRLMGVDVYFYPMPYPFPFSVQSSAALCAIAKKIRNHPSFGGFGNERRVLELVFNGTETFESECGKFIDIAASQKVKFPDMYIEPEDVEEPEESEEVTEEEETEGGNRWR